MARWKIDYGIDLGTTNSAIACIREGQPVIIKSDTLKDTLPSCVAVNKKRSILTGDSASNAMRSDKLRAMRNFDPQASNSFIEFKRTMGTDKKYPSSILEKDFTSEELSAEVLKALKALVPEEEINAVVITVPAKFTINQKDATLRAAELAGFAQCELLQEPIAAAMAYGLNSETRDGTWLVFDFGGGTFDAALIKVEEGIMKVIDTDGDNWLGGKNLDYAIVDEIILKYIKENYSINSILEEGYLILREAMKPYAEEAKIRLSFTHTCDICSDPGDIPGQDDEGREFELDITLTREDMKKTLGPVFQTAIDVTLDLLSRNNLTGEMLDALVPVGGPTYSPVLRDMLTEQIRSPDTSVDPTTVVARGAALFASTCALSPALKEKDRGVIALELGYESTTVEEDEYVTIKQSSADVPGKMFLEITRSDQAWSSGRIPLSPGGEVIEVKLIPNRPNSFTLALFDSTGSPRPCEPRSFIIIQGSRIGSPTLPYNIGIEIKDSLTGKAVFRGVRGLRKNQPVPAVGTADGLKTQKALRPGVPGDRIKIALYQGEHDAENTRAIYSKHIYDVIITGEEVPTLLPEGSDVDLTIKVDRSERISLSAFFPLLDYTFDMAVPRQTTQKEIDGAWLEKELEKSLDLLEQLKQEAGPGQGKELEKLEEALKDHQKRFAQGRGDYDRKKNVLEALRRSLRKLDELREAGRWPRVEGELNETLIQLEQNDSTMGDELSKHQTAQYREQVLEISREQNLKLARELITAMRRLNFSIMEKGLGVQLEIRYIQGFHNHFNAYQWSDREKARTLIDHALKLMENNPTRRQLRPLMVELFNLLPPADQEFFSREGEGSELIG